MSKRGENIYKRKDGRWEGRFYSGLSIDGKKKYSSIYGKSYKEVKNKLIEIKNKKLEFSKNKVKLGYVGQAWLKYVKLNVKRSTLENYTYLFNKHILPSLGIIDMNKLCSADINRFIKEKLEKGKLKQSGGLSRKYLRDILSIIKSIANFCEEEYEIIDKIRNVTMPKLEKKEIKILDIDEQKKLKKHINKNKTYENLAVLISMYTGLRIGEVCGLKWEDFDEKEGVIYIRRSVQRIYNNKGGTEFIVDKPKTNSSVRVIPLPKFLYDILVKIKGENNCTVLSGNNNFVEPNTIRKNFKKLIKLCGIKKIRFHDLRHTFASNCVKLNFDIKSLSEIMGHSNVTMTLNRYVHSSLSQKRKLMNNFNI